MLHPKKKNDMTEMIESLNCFKPPYLEILWIQPLAVITPSSWGIHAPKTSKTTSKTTPKPYHRVRFKSFAEGLGGKLYIHRHSINFLGICILQGQCRPIKFPRFENSAKLMTVTGHNVQGPQCPSRASPWRG